MKRILFLSGIDFKNKSIQVIKKTPESYAKAGWQVDYVVARDNCPNGNYFYEEEINPDAINIFRMYWPIALLRSKAPRHVALLLNKIASLIVVIKLFLCALKLVRKAEYDVLYGYELQGVLAVNLLKPFLARKTKIVSRFQGTFSLNELFVKKQYARLAFNIDLILAIRAKSDLIIVTDDGTQGDVAVKRIKRKKPYTIAFWPNGVDVSTRDHGDPLNTNKSGVVLISISRLVSWKKVDRILKVADALLKKGFNNFVYYVVGDGSERAALTQTVSYLKLGNHVVFLGALTHSLAMAYLAKADFFLSMYDYSNVGNPLLEAIKSNKIIVTLSNGTTGKWIAHKDNGLIYDPLNINFSEIAVDIIEIAQDQDKQKLIKSNVRKLEVSKLLTWKTRLEREISLVDTLVS